MSQWFLRLAVLYLIAGVSLGIFMAASHDHTMHPVHAHLNLLGWVTMALFAFFYRAWPEAAASRLAKVHFWLYVPAHFVQMVSLAALFRGVTTIEPLLGAASALVGIAILLFAFTVWKYTGAGQPQRVSATATA
ncbi:MAG: cytochrome-c oxidase [Moraxellaceae bacterium]|nr:MAG: cytochrome-c oxidase [Moraxellaceae bacterium]